MADIFGGVNIGWIAGGFGWNAFSSDYLLLMID
jgi:hypothetical protein